MLLVSFDPTYPARAGLVLEHHARAPPATTTVADTADGRRITTSSAMTWSVVGILHAPDGEFAPPTSHTVTGSLAANTSNVYDGIDVQLTWGSASGRVESSSGGEVVVLFDEVVWVAERISKAAVRVHPRVVLLI